MSLNQHTASINHTLYIPGIITVIHIDAIRLTLFSDALVAACTLYWPGYRTRLLLHSGYTHTLKTISARAL